MHGPNSPSAAWLAAGATSAKNWLLAYTNLSYREAQRLERIAELCAAHRDLADGVVSGALSLRRAEVLGRAVTAERAPHLDKGLAALLELNGNTSDDEAFAQAVQFWKDQVDQDLAVRHDRPQSLVLCERLFGGGDIHGSLAPVPFATVKAGIDAFTQDPDPADAPYRRCLSERRADALDDMASFALTHDPDAADDTDSDDRDDGGWEEMRAEDTFDSSYPGDDLDEALTTLTDDDNSEEEDRDRADGLDRLVLLRRRVRRRVRARSGVCANIHIDLRTLAGIRDVDDLDDLVLRGEGWSTTRAAAERLQRCHDQREVLVSTQPV